MSEKNSLPNVASTSLPFSKVWPLGLLFALVIGAVFGILWTIVITVSAKQGQEPGLLKQGMTFAISTILVGGIAFPICLMFMSRSLADRIFSWIGFLATFFGLFVLALLFCQLGYDAVQWFRVMPVMVENRNEELSKLKKQIQQPGYIKSKVAVARKEVQEAISGLQKEIDETKDEQTRSSLQAKKKLLEANEEKIVLLAKEDIEKTVAEWKETVKEQRENTSGLALLGHFLWSGTSSTPQNTGIGPALAGSLWIALITILFAVPIGVGAALYLEEYRSTGWLSNLIRININNLAGVPSVVYGILGAFVFVELIFKPLASLDPEIAARNLLGGGLTLGLLTLPVIIVAAQEAIRAVPKSIREGAYALGATQWQTIWHQVLPPARPGILTGTILAISRAIGEAAPLVLFGALYVINQNPTMFSRFSILPLQIFGWADRPEVPVTFPDGSKELVPIWRYNAAMTSLVLLFVLLGLNAVAITLRNRAQKQSGG